MSPRTSSPSQAPSPDVRQRLLDTAADLFYREGVRAIGIDLIIERAQVAKTSLYRHFRTKDDLIAAFLAREDEVFWAQWDEVVKRHAPDAPAELDALLQWIGQRVARPGYRGCPQLNVAAEFADPEHPARRIAAAHKREQQRRFSVLCKRLGARKPDLLAAQLSMLVDGAFTSGPLLLGEAAGKALRAAGAALAAASLK